MPIRENYLRIMENVQSAAVKAGRNPADIRLIAVTKFVDIERIREAAACGVRSVGENRVQEWQGKSAFFTQNGLASHLIGQLQSNKVKYVTGQVELIQSVDRLSLAKEIDRQAALRGVKQDVLVEVNIGGEAQKGGVLPLELPGLFEEISALPSVCVKGLMCVPPAVGPEEAQRYFAQMRELFMKHSTGRYPNVFMQQLSMGMSGDYMAAIAEGATMVRIGTALFGARG